MMKTKQLQAPRHQIPLMLQVLMQVQQREFFHAGELMMKRTTSRPLQAALKHQIRWQQLQVLMLQMLVELRNQAESYLEKSRSKHLATQEEKNPSRAFVDNQLLLALQGSSVLADYLKKHLGQPGFGICHGTRRGKEQEM